MNNKGEKSFSDLFLSANDDTKKDEVTFGAFSNNSSNEEKNVSFSNFSDMANVGNEVSDNKKLTTDTNIFNVASSMVSNLDNAKTEQQSNDVSFSSINTNVDDNGINELDKSVEVENNGSNEFSFFDMNSSGVESVNNDLYIDKKVEDIPTGKIEVNVDDISSFGAIMSTNDGEENLVGTNNEVNDNSINNEENNIFMSVSPTSDVESSSNIQENTLDVSNKISEEMSNVFGNSNSDNIENDNESGGIIKLESTSNGKSIFDDVNKVENNEEVTKKSSVDSPFFVEDESSNDNSNELNPLLSNTISLDEGSKTKKNVGKINLNNTKNFEVKVVPKNEPLIKFIVGVISYAFFIWLLLIGITLLVYVLDIKIRASKGDYSAPTFNAYVVLTGSMLPDIQVNDVVVTKRVEAETLQVGDIITFASADSRFAGTIITHRIIKVNPSKDKGGITFQTKGDNNNVADSTLVPEANIYGKVILKIPKLGYLQEFLATDGGWILVILIPCLTVISYDVVKLFKGLKRKKYDNIKVKK